MAKFTAFQLALVAGMLISGTINTVVKSSQNDCWQLGYYTDYQCYNEDTLESSYNETACLAADYTWTNERQFDAPWTQTLLMFIGESLTLWAFLIERRRVVRGEREPLLGPQHALNDDPEEIKLRNERAENSASLRTPLFQPILLIPTLCDLTGTTLAGIGLLYIYASVWQMMRGSIIIFTGILSVIFLGRKLRAIHWTGLASATLGLALVGMASILQLSADGSADPHSQSQTVLGIILVLAGQVASAVQFVVEERFLKGRSFHPLHVVGLEGSFGSLIMLIIVLPVVYAIPGPQQSSMSRGSQENSIDAAYMIKNNYVLLILCVGYVLSIAFYNYCGLAVTKSLSAIHRTLIDALRTILVWIVDLLLFYAFKSPNYGEIWTNYGFLQLGGFGFVVFGTLLYKEIITLPCLFGRK
eukprot:m.70382 g.70382  ORF g.70382 m.70382 type:complete len:415 (-) comp50132_c0_seq1:75-1319(-)